MLILDEEFLRREVLRAKALRSEHPDLWRQMESDRRARNREMAVVNRRLRAEGLKPVALELSLVERVRKLQQLEKRNEAESAKSKSRS